jgi:hypothetical protein
MAAQQWLQFYEQAYFLTNSPFVEDEACQLLNADAPLNLNDFKLIMGWKMAAIDHKRSEQHHRIIYREAWGAKLMNYRRSYTDSLKWLVQNQQKLHVATRNAQNAFDLLVRAKKDGHLAGFDTTYMLTILFFLTHGQQPIYDRFVHKALHAIANQTVPRQPTVIQRVTNWQKYLVYQGLLAPVAEACDLAIPVPRSLDRALWVSLPRRVIASLSRSSLAGNRRFTAVPVVARG